MPISPSRFRHSARFATILLGSTILAGAAVSAHAQTVTWNGTTSKDWDTAANWNENHVPTADDTVIIDNAKNEGSFALKIGDASIYRLQVGTAADSNSMLIVSGSLFFSGSAPRARDLIGANGGTGSVQISDAGSIWRSTGIGLGVGSGSMGDLIIRQGARLEAGSIDLGTGGGIGSLTVADSTALVGNLRVGSADGGQGEVSTSASTMGMDDVTITNGTFDTAASILTAADVRINALNQGSTASMTLRGSSLDAHNLYVGGETVSGQPDVVGTGSLSLKASTLNTALASIGVGNGSVGSVDLNDTRWRADGPVRVGYDGGQGTLYLQEHSQLELASVRDLTLGVAGGTGSLTVFTGSSINARYLVIGGAGGTGTASFDLVGTALLEGLRIGGGQDALGQWVAGHGTLSITNASSVNAQQRINYIGIGAGSTADVTVGNQSSLGLSADTLIGVQGGTAKIALDNSTLATGGNVISGGDGGKGSIVLADQSTWTAAGNVTLGSNYGTGDVLLSGGSTATFAGRLGVGGAVTLDPAGGIALDSGSGTLGVTGGSTVAVTGQPATVGTGLGSKGSIRVSDAGSGLSFANTVTVGAYGGIGEIGVLNGGKLSLSGLTQIGYRSVAVAGSTTFGVLSADNGMIDSSGIVVGDSAGGFFSLANRSALTNTAPLTLGANGGAATAIVKTGSTLTNNGLLAVGSGGGATGVLTIDGAESRWRQTGAVTVGNGAIGQIYLANGAKASVDLAPGAGTVTLGDGGMGTLRVDDAGTSLDVTGGSFLLGRNGGTGGLTARNGGAVTGNRAVVAGTGVGSSGVLAALGPGSSVTITGPTLFGTSGGSGFIVAQNGGSIDLGSAITIHRFGDGAGSVGGVNVDSGGKVTLRGEVDFGDGQPRGRGTASIDGAGSRLAILSGPFNMRAGTVAVTNGGALFTGNGANIGGLDGAVSSITISGAGSIWIPAAATYIGGQLNAAGNAAIAGRGEVYLLGGASLGGGNARIGNASLGGSGLLLVDMDSSAAAGEYRQGAGGVLAIGFDPTTNGRAGRLTSDGAVSFADGTHVAFMRQSAGRYQIGNRYLIVRSINEPISRGTIVFDGLDQQSLFVGLRPTFEALGQGEALYLDAAQLRSFASVAKTPNQIAAAGGADSLANAAAVKAAILDLQTEDQARGAFDAISGELHPSIRGALFDESRLPRMAVLNRLTEAEGGAGAWAQGFGNWGSTDSDGNAAAIDRDTKGGLIGIDASLGDGKLRVGVAGGYGDTRLAIAARASRADITSYSALAYLGGSFGKFQLRAGAGYTWSKVDARRTVAFPGFNDGLRSQYDASTLQGFGEIGYRQPVAGGWIEPFAGVSTVGVHTDGARESGGAAALTFGTGQQTVTASTAGLKAATSTTGRIVANATLGWQHVFGNRLPTDLLSLAGGTPFTVAGLPLSRDAAVAELSLGWRLSPATTISARYSGSIGQRSVDNAVKATISIGF